MTADAGRSTAALQRWLRAERADAATTAAAQAWLAAHTDASVIARDDAEYPAALRELPDAPAFLAVRGNVARLQVQRAVAVVGARQATPYGVTQATALAGDLGRSGVTVVSGFARGIDAAAHRAAAATAGGTVAVLGTGPDIGYPATHGPLRDAILAGGGVLLTQFLPGTRPFAGNFPRRNVLIAALSSATVVVEAREQSGAVLTAGLAGEQGREVLAVPGRVGERSGGCHRLIRDGAGLVESAADILAALGWQAAAPAAAVPTAVALTDDEAALLRALDCERHADELAAVISDSGMLAALLTELELAGQVERRPGRLYALTAAGRAAAAGHDA